MSAKESPFSVWRVCLLLITLGLTAWTALQAATLVHAGIVGGPPTDSLVFLSTGVVTLILGFVTVRAWRRVAAKPHHPLPDPWDGGDDPDTEDAEGAEARRHPGLSGDVQPPRRW